MGYSEKGKRGFQSTHCLSTHPLYDTWNRIKNRCYNERSKDYKDYGLRGIVMCDAWRNDFVEFLYWALKNGWEKGLSIERKNVDGNYEPDNCEWIPVNQQSKNRRTCNFVTYKGETHTIAEWSRITGIARKTLELRLKSKNFTLEEAFETPVNKNIDKLNHYMIKHKLTIKGMAGEKLIITDQATGEEYVVEDLGYPI